VVGDPIEVEAISRALNHKSGRPILIGTVKSNLGHSEAVSGICSIIKATLILEHGLIPPTIGTESFNPNLRLEERNLKVVTQTTQWPTSLRRISVNSFGYGGANAHAILESADSHVSLDSVVGETGENVDRKLVLPLSGYTKRCLNSRISAFCSTELEHVNIHDLAHTLNLRLSSPTEPFSYPSRTR
jgi:acyl transferase domain-containing protein